MLFLERKVSEQNVGEAGSKQPMGYAVPSVQAEADPQECKVIDYTGCEDLSQVALVKHLPCARPGARCSANVTPLVRDLHSHSDLDNSAPIVSTVVPYPRCGLPMVNCGLKTVNGKFKN